MNKKDIQIEIPDIQIQKQEVILTKSVKHSGLQQGENCKLE